MKENKKRPGAGEKLMFHQTPSDTEAPKGTKDAAKSKKELEKAELKQEKREKKIRNEHIAAKKREFYLKAKHKKAMDSQWWKLDNTAIIYPANSSKTWPAVFRISVHLKEEVKPGILQQAADEIMPRFPYFNVRIKKGIFWHYFEEMPFYPIVKRETKYPCRNFDISSKKHLFRILYYNKKISVEFFHALCDGKGAFKYVTTLLYMYFKLQGIEIKEHDSFLNPLDLPRKEEVDDAFSNYADFKSFNSRNRKIGYQVKGTPLERGQQYVYTGVMDINEFKTAAKKYDASLTEYLMAVVLFVCEAQRKVFKIFNRPAGVQIPIDLRRFFPTETLRNFTAFKFITLPVDFSGTLEDIIKILKKEFSGVNPESLMKNINTNVRTQKNKLIRIAPLPLKNVALKLSARMFGERQVTTTVSNVGSVNAPEEFKNYIDFYECILGITLYNKFIATCCSYNGKITVAFTSKIQETTIFSQIFKRFSDDGVNVMLLSNKEV